ncbi:MAG TPA: PEP-CTERM sorting domain-containing protein [Candidatus Paceibacterota bacterium]|nr:PEP-CTERM sorting domain-containing protein [Verrucomicrobiota bacterium]HOX03391.1 PEP-CTERM sorting domain-containing protein [Verrucomicrobiota bacterium]HRZ46818.1 PEP-CTERM sorting domain-containing protein [Candidatus Paceibacterota bacterium]HRZ91805.1 PEP-CTERM sorting domain-containing protein [Candidatus Paceibacterota bacterium]
MKRNIVFAAAIALAITANAQVVFYDDFESYTDQAAFSAAWNVGVAGGGAILSTEQAASGAQSIKQDLTNKASGKDFTPTSGSDAQPLEWSFMFYDSTQEANLRQFATIRDNSPALAQLVAVGAYNDTTLTKNLFTGASVTAADLNTYYACRVAFAPGPNWFILNTEGVPTRSTGWHEIKAVFGDTTADFYVDGILGMADIPYAASAGAITFDRVTVGSGLSSANGVGYYDNVTVALVPEPSTIALGLLGGLGLLARRFRK